ncbi:MAG TPA: ribonuclease P protein component [Candidatus Bacteroides merdigallinarum]|uniref:Ribonuclease P protein component n=1 Tax=Candidatus Bacteroides merdigallinarum TaxID=2838473 RepID=A0A9D2J184_9BACE|nr:ribonuclease P protein component [Candidatus Bacteroides merdigallinarum]
MINTLHKAERLNRKKVIEKMFAGGSRSFSLFPLRVVWLPVDELDAPVSILVSVSKRRFKRAVKRNRVKRRVREAYRLNKQPLLEIVEQAGCRVAIAFIYLSDRVADSEIIVERMRTALQRIGETLSMSKVRKEAGGAKE